MYEGVVVPVTDGERAELAQKYDANASDCARWSREARAKCKAAMAAGNDVEAEKQAKIARQWGRQERQLKDDAAALRAGLGGKPQVGIRGAWRAAPMKKW